MTNWNDKEDVIKVVSEYAFELVNASDELKADREIVLAAVQNDTYGMALQYASKELKADREIVLTAVQKKSYPSALVYASEDLRADREIVLAAVQTSGGASPGGRAGLFPRAIQSRRCLL